MDSTRRGKSMPDALAKTVPIWCAVMNRLLFEDDKIARRLFTPENVVGKSEHEQISLKIEGFVQDAKVRCWEIGRFPSNLTPRSLFNWISRLSDPKLESPSAHSGSHPTPHFPIHKNSKHLTSRSSVAQAHAASSAQKPRQTAIFRAQATIAKHGLTE